MIGRIQEASYIQALTGAALSQNFAYNEHGMLNAVYIKATVAITETITITRKSRLGSSYDIVLDTRTLNSEQNYIFHPNWNVVLFRGDSIQIQCTNANLTGTVNGIIHFEGGFNGT